MRLPRRTSATEFDPTRAKGKPLSQMLDEGATFAQIIQALEGMILEDLPPDAGLGARAMRLVTPEPSVKITPRGEGFSPEDLKSMLGKQLEDAIGSRQAADWQKRLQGSHFGQLSEAQGVQLVSVLNGALETERDALPQGQEIIMNAVNWAKLKDSLANEYKRRAFSFGGVVTGGHLLEELIAVENVLPDAVEVEDVIMALDSKSFYKGIGSAKVRAKLVQLLMIEKGEIHTQDSYILQEVRRQGIGQVETAVEPFRETVVPADFVAQMSADIRQTLEAPGDDIRVDLAHTERSSREQVEDWAKVTTRNDGQTKNEASLKVVVDPDE